jgi:hypothetical protein
MEERYYPSDWVVLYSEEKVEKVAGLDHLPVEQELECWKGIREFCLLDEDA